MKRTGKSKMMFLSKASLNANNPFVYGHICGPSGFQGVGQNSRSFRRAQQRKLARLEKKKSK